MRFEYQIEFEHNQNQNQIRKKKKILFSIFDDKNSIENVFLCSWLNFILPPISNFVSLIIWTLFNIQSHTHQSDHTTNLLPTPKISSLIKKCFSSCLFNNQFF